MSSLHSNVAPAALEVKVNEALVALVRALGPPVMVVSGGVVTTGSTITVPVIAGWTKHTNEYVPAVSNWQYPSQPAPLTLSGIGGTVSASLPGLVLTQDDGCGPVGNVTLCMLVPAPRES